MSSVLPYTVLAAALFLTSFGIHGILCVLVTMICCSFGFIFVIYTRGYSIIERISHDTTEVVTECKFDPGNEALLRCIKRFKESSVYHNKSSMTNSPHMDHVIEQILQFSMRDFVDVWYKQVTDDENFRESLLRTARRSIASLSHSMRAVDWVPFVTRHVADDIASHLRLFRMASERANAQRARDANAPRDDLESHFFDLELEMERDICRDLLSTTPHYENAYLHDLVDILLYLLMPPEDFRCRPLRFLLREVMVKRVITPTLDHLSDPDNVNQLLVWVLSEVNPRPEDLLSSVEMSVSQDELDAIVIATRDQLLVLRGKDSGGEQGELVKQQMSSLEHLETLIKKKKAKLAEVSVEKGCDAVLVATAEELVQLPLHVVLNNSVAVSHFLDYLVTVGGQNYIDCYLAIEGFKVSVEHQLRSLANGETTEIDVIETVREAAKFMYEQFLSQEAITRVPLDESIVNRLLNRMKKEDPSDDWFQHIQDKIAQILKSEDRFYPAFKRTSGYTRMLMQLGIVSESERGEAESATPSDNGSANSHYAEELPVESKGIPECGDMTGEPVISAVVETLGIGQQGRQAFALYNIRVIRTLGGRRVSGCNVLRRYSDFHLLHSLVQQKFPALSTLSFPGKKTFNNLNAHFLERRTKALNSYMECILQPSMLRLYPGLDKIVLDFLSQKEYSAKVDILPKKVMSAMLDPIKSGVRALGSAVTAMPEQVYGGVSRVGDGINHLMKNKATILPETDRVASAISAQSTASIPLRVLLLLVDEVFGVRVRSAWFRRQLLALLKQLITPLGTSINRRIVDLVHWLSSEKQVTAYLTALRETVWPGGRLSASTSTHSPSFHHRCRLLTRSLILSALPDELRLILGADTCVQGISTLSSALQHPHLNRRLLYVLLERLLITIFPNNRFERIFAQLHSKSPRSRSV